MLTMEKALAAALKDIGNTLNILDMRPAPGL